MARSDPYAATRTVPAVVGVLAVRPPTSRDAAQSKMSRIGVPVLSGLVSPCEVAFAS